MKFWDRVEACKHENLTDYCDSRGCGTPYCDSSTVVHCRDCGVYIEDCRCGTNNGMSGWPAARWSRIQRQEDMRRWRKHQEAGA